MSTYTIYSDGFSPEQLKGFYNTAKRRLQTPDFNFTELDRIFEIASAQPDRFPNIPVNDDDLRPVNYMTAWIKRYIDDISNPPSSRIAQPKGSCNDPALKLIVRETQNINEEEAEDREKAHCLFMSAENIQGQLLEEYVSIKTRPYGFLWCAGMILRAVDFCNLDGTLFLQIKNKFNTENSSSSAVRAGTTIQKWHRLGEKTVKGKKYPVYRWEKLNRLVNQYSRGGASPPPELLSESDYRRFLSSAARENPYLITDATTSPCVFV